MEKNCEQRKKEDEFVFTELNKVTPLNISHQLVEHYKNCLEICKNIANINDIEEEFDINKPETWRGFLSLLGYIMTGKEEDKYLNKTYLENRKLIFNNNAYSFNRKMITTQLENIALDLNLVDRILIYFNKIKNEYNLEIANIDEVLRSLYQILDDFNTKIHNLYLNYFILTEPKKIIDKDDSFLNFFEKYGFYPKAQFGCMIQFLDKFKDIYLENTNDYKKTNSKIIVIIVKNILLSLFNKSYINNYLSKYPKHKLIDIKSKIEYIIDNIFNIWIVYQYIREHIEDVNKKINNKSLFISNENLIKTNKLKQIYRIFNVDESTTRYNLLIKNIQKLFYIYGFGNFTKNELTFALEKLEEYLNKNSIDEKYRKIKNKFLKKDDLENSGNLNVKKLEEEDARLDDINKFKETIKKINLDKDENEYLDFFLNQYKQVYSFFRKYDYIYSFLYAKCNDIFKNLTDDKNKVLNLDEYYMIRSFIWLSKKILIKLNDSFYNDNFYNKNTEKYRYAVKYFSWYHMQFLNCLKNIFINNEYKELNVKFLKIDTIHYNEIN